MPELCDDCGVADSKGVPCYLMFREGTDIQMCTGYAKDPKRHEKLKKAHGKKPAAPEGGGE